MEQSCSQHDCKEGSELGPSSSLADEKTDIKTESAAVGIENISPDTLIDEIERRDLEEENQLINLCPQLTEDTSQSVISSEVSENDVISGSGSTSRNEHVHRICIPEKEMQPSDSTNSSSTPDNCRLKKNHVYTMNFTPLKLGRPSCIPKYKLFEDEEESNKFKQSSFSVSNLNGFDISKHQILESKSDISEQKCINNESSSNNSQRMADKSNQTVDNPDNNSNDGVNTEEGSVESMIEDKQGTSCELNIGESALFEDIEGSSIVHSSVPFLVHEDPDSGDIDDEETACTCLLNSALEDYKTEEGDKEKLSEKTTMFDSDAEEYLRDENLRLMRKRKMESPPSRSVKKLIDDPGITDVSEHPAEVQSWLTRFSLWSGSERLRAIDLLIGHCAADQVRHMMKAIEPLFQCDFISLLPRELALAVLGHLKPPDLLRAAQTCRRWRYLADDDLLWKDKCKQIGIVTLPKRVWFRPAPVPPENTWKATFMRQHYIDINWRKKSTASPKILKGHDDHVITCLQFHGNRILSGSDDTTLKLWSATTGRWLRTLVGHTGGVWSSQMRGRTVISGSTDRTLRIWDASTGASLRTLTGHTSTVRCMHLFNDKVVSGSRDATLRVWSVPDGKCLRVLVGHMAAVRCVQYNGKLVVSGAYDYFVKVWNPETAECIHTLAGHSNRVYSLQFDGRHVVSGSLDTSIMVWDVESGSLKHTLRGHQSITSGMELKSNILMSGNADSTVKVWDIRTGQCLHTLAGQNKHQSAVTCVQSNSRFAITSSDDGTVKMWDLKTGDFVRNLVTLPSGGSGGVVWRIRASRTKLVCAVGSRNGTEETKLMVLDFDTPGACRRCDIL